MDGMLLPSLFEGLPLVAIEWQINGLPCLLSDTITSDCKLTNIVEFMSLNNSAREWAQEILKIINSGNRLVDALNSYRVIYDSKYNIRKAARELERIYKYY